MQFLKSLKAAFSGGHEGQPQHFHPPARPPITITPEKIHSMVLELNIERIKRVMMLFDIRWINEKSESYIPTEEEIAQTAYMNMANAVLTGRVLGAAEVRDKGFVSSFLQLPTGNEVLNISYVLTSASNVK